MHDFVNPLLGGIKTAQNSHGVLREAHCPVVVTRAEGSKNGKQS